MNVPPERTADPERERRWMRPAGIAGILGVAAIIIGGAIKASALEGDTYAEELLNAASGDADGSLLIGTIVFGAAFLLFAGLLTFLILSARDRSSRVLAQLIPIAAIAAVISFAGQIAANSAYLNAADDFAESEATREAEPAPSSEPADAKDGEKGEAEGTTTTETADEGTTTATTETSAEEAEEEAEDEADDRARDARDDASGAALAGLLSAVGALGFAVGFLYSSLWSMRTGLVTRFWGSLGIAASIVSILLPAFFVVALVWFLAMGLMLLGLWAGGRPPAWESGVAMPWPKAGEPAPDADPRDPPAGQDSLEGSGREIAEPPLPEDQAPADGGEPPSDPPQKRKRRR